MLTESLDDHSKLNMGSPIESALEWSASLRVGQAISTVVATWLLLILTDAATGRMLSINGLYLIPLCLTTWCLGRWPAFATGAAAVGITSWINGFGDGLSAQASTIPSAIAAWNSGIKIFAVVFIILMVSAFRRVFDRERRHARIDPLTGLGNRRAFVIERQKLQLAGARDNRIMLSGVFDLDAFKTINDQYGHAAGDQTLRVAADALNSAVRPYAVTARFGGDEFAFCLLVRDREAALQVVAKIHRSVSAALSALSWPASCSMGAIVSEVTENGFDRADAAMYGAKQGGYGQYVVL